MAETFRRAVLDQPAIASLVFAFQCGFYADVRQAFRACDELVEFSRLFYECDVAFPEAFAPHTVWDGRLTLIPEEYCLGGNGYDDRLPLHVAIYENLALLTERMLECRPDLASEDAIILALQSCRLEIVALLLEKRETVPELRQSNNLVQDGTVLRNRNISTTFLSSILEQTNSSGVEMLQRFGPRATDFDHIDKQIATANATFDNLTIALQLFPWLFYPDLFDDVAGRGFLPLVRSLHERGLECSTVAMDQAAAQGHLEVVRFLHEHRSEGCTSEALDGAISNGHLEVARFLIKHRTEGASANILNLATANGHLDVVTYLHSLGTFGCTVDAVDKAVLGGHLDVVAFLLMNRHEGCSRDDVVGDALEEGHLRTAEYLLSLGYPFPTATICPSYEAFRKPDIINIIKLLLAHNMPCDPEWMRRASSLNNVPLVRFLHGHPNVCSHTDVIWQAIDAKAWDAVDFLLANCTADVSVHALRLALGFGNLVVVSRILRRQPELHHDDLLGVAVRNRNMEAITYCLTAGIGKPRQCLLYHAYHRQHSTTNQLLLPYCMDATKSLDNVVFLLKLYETSDDRARTLQLMSSELPYQARKAAKSVPFVSSVAARATSLLHTGEVLDGALALVISHLYATDADVTAARLTRLADLVFDGELKTQLYRFITRKRKRYVHTV